MNAKPALTAPPEAKTGSPPTQSIESIISKHPSWKAEHRKVLRKNAQQFDDRFVLPVGNDLRAKISLFQCVRLYFQR